MWKTMVIRKAILQITMIASVANTKKTVIRRCNQMLIKVHKVKELILIAILDSTRVETVRPITNRTRTKMIRKRRKKKRQS